MNWTKLRVEGYVFFELTFRAQCCFIARLSYNFSATGANEIYEFRGPYTRGLVRTSTHARGTKTKS